MHQDYNFEDLSKIECELEDLKTLNRSLLKKKNLILCVNIRSLNANFEKLEIFIESLSAKKPCIIICTETWNLQYPQYYQLQGYKSYYNESKINKADGVILYVKNNIYEETRLEVIDRLSIVTSDISLLSGEKIRVSAMYRCHDIPKTEFINSVRKFLSINVNIKNHCIFGDFNIDIRENNENNNNFENNISQDFLNNYLEHEYIPYFRGITRLSLDNTKGTCIDNCFAKTRNVELESFKLNVPFNDHYPLIISIERLKIQKSNEKIETYINYSKLRNIAKKIQWNCVTRIQDPNNALNELIKMIHSCVEKSTCTKAPNRKKKMPSYLEKNG